MDGWMMELDTHSTIDDRAAPRGAHCLWRCGEDAVACASLCVAVYGSGGKATCVCGPQGPSASAGPFMLFTTLFFPSQKLKRFALFLCVSWGVGFMRAHLLHLFFLWVQVGCQIIRCGPFFYLTYNQGASLSLPPTCKRRTALSAPAETRRLPSWAMSSALTPSECLSG